MPACFFFNAAGATFLQAICCSCVPRCRRPSLCIVRNQSPSSVFASPLVSVRRAFLCHHSFSFFWCCTNCFFSLFGKTQHRPPCRCPWCFTTVVMISSPGWWDISSLVFRRSPFFGRRGPIHAASRFFPRFFSARSHPFLPARLPRVPSPSDRGQQLRSYLVILLLSLPRIRGRHPHRRLNPLCRSPGKLPRRGICREDPVVSARIGLWVLTCVTFFFYVFSPSSPHLHSGQRLRFCLHRQENARTLDLLGVL